MSFCPSCGKPTKPAQKFCTSCGTKLIAASPASTPAPTTTTPTTPSPVQSPPVSPKVVSIEPTPSSPKSNSGGEDVIKGTKSVRGVKGKAAANRAMFESGGAKAAAPSSPKVVSLETLRKNEAESLQRMKRQAEAEAEAERSRAAKEQEEVKRRELEEKKRRQDEEEIQQRKAAAEEAERKRQKEAEAEVARRKESEEKLRRQQQQQQQKEEEEEEEERERERLAQQQRKAAAEEAEAEAQRKAEAAAAKKKAEEEAKRIAAAEKKRAEEQAEAEAERKAEAAKKKAEEAEAKRIAAAEKRKAEEEARKKAEQERKETAPTKTVSAPVISRTAPAPTPSQEEPKPPSTGGTLKKSIGGMWEQNMQQKKEEQFQQERDKLRARRKGGVEFVDSQIRVLMVEIAKISKVNPKNSGVQGVCPAICYGDLFNATMGSMPALSAILHTARKKGVVQYQGEMLMQGLDDDVLVTLLKDSIEDSPDFKSMLVKRPKEQQETLHPAKCTGCAKTVYPMERIAPNGKVFHKGCFRCEVCKRTLELKAYAYLNEKFYCESDFKAAYMAGGGNYNNAFSN